MTLETIAIRPFTDPAIHTVCEEVKEINQEELIELSGKMFAIMKMNRGIGLAANQVGLTKRIALVSLENNTKSMFMINPVLLSYSKKREDMQEGCLSCPGVLIPMRRPKEIVVEFTTIKGEKEKYQLTDLDARIVLHELDHLNGRCIIDNANVFNTSIRGLK